MVAGNPGLQAQAHTQNHMSSLKEKLFLLLSEHSITLGLVTEPSPALSMAWLIRLHPADTFTIRQCQQMKRVQFICHSLHALCHEWKQREFSNLGRKSTQLDK